jgi:hypothetical protein
MNGEPVVSAMTQAALTSWIQVPMLLTKTASHSLRNVGWVNGDHAPGATALCGGDGWLIVAFRFSECEARAAQRAPETPVVAGRCGAVRGMGVAVHAAAGAVRVCMCGSERG